MSTSTRFRIISTLLSLVGLLAPLPASAAMKEYVVTIHAAGFNGGPTDPVDMTASVFGDIENGSTRQVFTALSLCINTHCYDASNAAADFEPDGSGGVRVFMGDFTDGGLQDDAHRKITTGSPFNWRSIFAFDQTELQFHYVDTGSKIFGATSGTVSMTSIVPPPVPVPAAVWLFGSTIPALMLLRRRPAMA